MASRTGSPNLHRTRARYPASTLTDTLGTSKVGLGAGSWWNPVTWLQNVAGFFHGAYDAGGAVLNVLGGALTILTQFFRFFFDTGHFIADAVNWLTTTLFPPELQTWFLGTIGEPGQQWNSAQIYMVFAFSCPYRALSWLRS